MDNVAPAPTAPPEPDNRITNVEELVVLPAGCIELACKIKTQAPRLKFSDAVEIARLTIVYRALPPIDPMIVAIEQHRAENQYAHGAYDGWREGMA